MGLRTILDLAATVRGRRKELGLSQAELARRAGLSRKWIYEFEAGNPTAELGRVLRVLEELGLSLEVARNLAAPAATPAIDLDALLDEYRGR
jgi:HTH-type transcriptional regulator/antitoxin HipB